MEQTKSGCEIAQKGRKPLRPIDFTVLGREWIQLADATSLRFCDLDGRDDRIFEEKNTGSSALYRMEMRHVDATVRSTSIITQLHHLISSWGTARAMLSQGRYV